MTSFQGQIDLTAMCSLGCIASFYNKVRSLHKIFRKTIYCTLTPRIYFCNKLDVTVMNMSTCIWDVCMYTYIHVCMCAIVRRAGTSYLSILRQDYKIAYPSYPSWNDQNNFLITIIDDTSEYWIFTSVTNM